MPAKKYIVELNADERERLRTLISKGKAPAKTILKARILLKADQARGGPNWRDAEIIKALDTNLSMVSRVRETLVIEGLDAVPLVTLVVVPVLLIKTSRRASRRISGWRQTICAFSDRDRSLKARIVGYQTAECGPLPT